jgi:hypothetical protein
MQEYQTWGFNINDFKTVYLNEGSDIQNIQLEHNITTKGSRPFRYLGTFLRIPKNAAKKY